MRMEIQKRTSSAARFAANATRHSSAARSICDCSLASDVSMAVLSDAEGSGEEEDDDEEEEEEEDDDDSGWAVDDEDGMGDDA